MAIERLTPDHSLWSDFCAHLARHSVADSVLTRDLMLQPGLYALCAVENNHIIGHIIIRMQRIKLPRATGTGPLSYITDPYDNHPLREIFVHTFAVDVHHRRRGYGRALQNAAMDLGRRLGCYQIRSWSPLECTENCALKLAMGFSAHPAIDTTSPYHPQDGIIFTKPLNDKTSG